MGNNKVNGFLQRQNAYDFSDVTDVKIIRINNITYYSINNGEYYQLQDFSVFSEYFDVPVTFGASLDENGKPFRGFKGTMSNMKIKFLSENTSINAYSLKYYKVDSTQFDGTNYIDTGVYLFDKNNLKKDFQIKFTLVSYEDGQEEYATILNSLNELNKSYLGFLFRFKKVTSTTTTTQVELVSNGTSKINIPFDVKQVTNVVLVRKNNKLYYTIAESENIEVLDYSDFTEYFSVPVTIGASLDEEGNAYRYFKGKVSNVEIMVKEDIY